MMDERTLTIILAGGKGTRLEPLTVDRAKPAVPFGGAYRIIDFALSNCVNSGLFRILMLTQYKSLSLDRHIERGWSHLFQRELGAALDIVPPQHRVDEEWYRGTADAVYQNIYSIDQIRPELVLILAGDHVYSMNYQEMIQYHLDSHAEVTIGAIRVPVGEAAGQFGVIQVDGSRRVIGFQEKPKNPAEIPGDPGFTLASMGIYVFSTRFLIDQLCANAGKPERGTDFGHHVLPAIYQDHPVYAYSFRAPDGRAPYWRDVGTIDAYFEASQDLLQPNSPLNLHDRDWPIRSYKPYSPPPMILAGGPGESAGEASNTIICSGARLEGATVRNSIIGADVRIGAGAIVEDCIIFDQVEIQPGARLHRAIVDKYSIIGRDTSVGRDASLDAAHGFSTSPSGITVVPRGTHTSRDTDPMPAYGNNGRK